MTEMEDDVKELFTGESSDRLDALKEMIDEDSNILMKTEIPNPRYFAVLQSLEHFLSKNGLNSSSNFLNHFIKYFTKDMVSKDRKGREEMIEIVRAMSDNAEPEEDEQHSGLFKNRS